MPVIAIESFEIFFSFVCPLNLAKFVRRITQHNKTKRKKVSNLLQFFSTEIFFRVFFPSENFFSEGVGVTLLRQ
jgi:hypothetical protein